MLGDVMLLQAISSCMQHGGFWICNKQHSVGGGLSMLALAGICSGADGASIEGAGGVAVGLPLSFGEFKFSPSR